MTISLLHTQTLKYIQLSHQTSLTIKFYHLVIQSASSLHPNFRKFLVYIKKIPMCDGTQKSIYNGIGSRLMVECHAKNKIYVNICIHVAELSLILFENFTRKFIFPIYFSVVNMKNCTKWKKFFFVYWEK